APACGRNAWSRRRSRPREPRRRSLRAPFRLHEPICAGKAKHAHIGWHAWAWREESLCRPSALQGHGGGGKGRGADVGRAYDRLRMPTGARVHLGTARRACLCPPYGPREWRGHFAGVAGNFARSRMSWIEPSAVRDAMASSTLLRRKVSFASRIAPTLTADSGKGFADISRRPANAGSDFCSAQNDGPHTRATPTVPRTTAPSANSSDPMGKRLQRCSAGSACRYWMSRKSALVPMVAPIALDFGKSASD